MYTIWGNWHHLLRNSMTWHLENLMTFTYLWGREWQWTRRICFTKYFTIYCKYLIFYTVPVIPPGHCWLN